MQGRMKETSMSSEKKVAVITGASRAWAQPLSKPIAISVTGGRDGTVDQAKQR